jgi:hypothetical protein
MKSFIFKLITIFFVFLFKAYGQQIKVRGKVTDTLNNPLPYANILAIPKSDDQEVKFAITEDDGSYKLGLLKNPKL